MGKKLLVINPDQCMEVPFDQQMTIGRDVYNSLSLQDIEVSRSHAIIFEQDGETILKDLKSRNGIYLRGEKVAEGVLQPGDEIIMGSTVMLFDPPETLDLGTTLSKRGKFLLEKRSGKPGRKAPELPETAFGLSDLDRSVLALFENPETTNFFSMTSALMLLKTFKEMDAAPDAQQLIEVTLRRSLTLLGGHRGVIMECDDAREHLKVRSILSVENTDTILIGQPILKVLLGAEKGIFCANIVRDKRYEQMAARCKRPIHSFVASPVRAGQELFGFIYLDSEDNSVSYDFAALRSLYFIGFHLGALLQTRAKHFHKHAAAGASLPISAIAPPPC